MKKKLLSVIVILLISIITIIPNFVFADDIDTGDYKNIYNSSGTSKVTDMGGQILGVVQVIGVSCGVIFLVILGIKYMMSSTNDKATIKERLIPYVIGAVIMFGGTAILSIVANFVRNLG